jgi:hypothetical protein
MKAISIRQPWAWLIVHGIKDIENRSWPTGYRGPLLIHASRTVDTANLDIVREACEAEGIDFPAELPTGGIVGEARIIDCVTESDSDWFNGPYGFVLRQARPLPFKPLRGRLGLFNIDPAQIGED